jgi:Skp family chaperone for outer membrane proteins
MKTLLFSIPTAALIAFFSLTPSAQAPARGPVSIGYISSQRIFSESIEGKAGVARVQTLQQQRANDLRLRQQTLDATRQQLAQATESATRSQLQQQEIQQRTDYDRATAQAQFDFQTLRRQVTTSC